jgi:AmmeMemoRadiSam system protein A
MPRTEHPAQTGHILLPLARAAIAREFGSVLAADDTPAWLQAPGACFVTLTQQAELRGCIGSLQAHRPLLDDLRANAVAAALHDPRFAPLTLRELNVTDIEVSLLSPMQPLDFDSEADALAQLRPGIDGLVFEFGARRSTFLPQVWEQLPHATDFMAYLKRKAGLPADFWHEDVRLQRYAVSKWRESELRLANAA